MNTRDQKSKGGLEGLIASHKAEIALKAKYPDENSGSDQPSTKPYLSEQEKEIAKQQPSPQHAAIGQQSASSSAAQGDQSQAENIAQRVKNVKDATRNEHRMIYQSIEQPSNIPPTAREQEIEGPLVHIAKPKIQERAISNKVSDPLRRTRPFDIGKETIKEADEEVRRHSRGIKAAPHMQGDVNDKIAETRQRRQESPLHYYQESLSARQIGGDDRGARDDKSKDKKPRMDKKVASQIDREAMDFTKIQKHLPGAPDAVVDAALGIPPVSSVSKQSSATSDAIAKGAMHQNKADIANPQTMDASRVPEASADPRVVAEGPSGGRDLDRGRIAQDHPIKRPEVHTWEDYGYPESDEDIANRWKNLRAANILSSSKKKAYLENREPEDMGVPQHFHQPRGKLQGKHERQEAEDFRQQGHDIQSMKYRQPSHGADSSATSNMDRQRQKYGEERGPVPQPEKPPVQPQQRQSEKEKFEASGQKDETVHPVQQTLDNRMETERVASKPDWPAQQTQDGPNLDRDEDLQPDWPAEQTQERKESQEEVERQQEMKARYNEDTQKQKNTEYPRKEETEEKQPGQHEGRQPAGEKAQRESSDSTTTAGPWNLGSAVSRWIRNERDTDAERDFGTHQHPEYGLPRSPSYPDDRFVQDKVSNKLPSDQPLPEFVRRAVLDDDKISRVDKHGVWMVREDGSQYYLPKNTISNRDGRKKEPEGIYGYYEDSPSRHDPKHARSGQSLLGSDSDELMRNTGYHSEQKNQGDRVVMQHLGRDIDPNIARIIAERSDEYGRYDNASRVPSGQVVRGAFGQPGQQDPYSDYNEYYPRRRSEVAHNYYPPYRGGSSEPQPRAEHDESRSLFSMIKDTAHEARRYLSNKLTRMGERFSDSSSTEPTPQRHRSAQEGRSMFDAMAPESVLPNREQLDRFHSQNKWDRDQTWQPEQYGHNSPQRGGRASEYAKSYTEERQDAPMHAEQQWVSSGPDYKQREREEEHRQRLQRGPFAEGTSGENTRGREGVTEGQLDPTSEYVKRRPYMAAGDDVHVTHMTDDGKILPRPGLQHYNNPDLPYEATLPTLTHDVSAQSRYAFQDNDEYFKLRPTPENRNKGIFSYSDNRRKDDEVAVGIPQHEMTAYLPM